MRALRLLIIAAVSLLAACDDGNRNSDATGSVVESSPPAMSETLDEPSNIPGETVERTLTCWEHDTEQTCSFPSGQDDEGESLFVPDTSCAELGIPEERVVLLEPATNDVCLDIVASPDSFYGEGSFVPEVNWRVEDACADGNPVHVVFHGVFDGSLTGQRWPADVGSLILQSGTSRVQTMSCVPFRQICLGAATTADPFRKWGLGLNGTDTCTNCCTSCNEAVSPTTLGCS